jgi:hypothetical protein
MRGSGWRFAGELGEAVKGSKRVVCTCVMGGIWVVVCSEFGENFLKFVSDLQAHPTWDAERILEAAFHLESDSSLCQSLFPP